MKAHKPTALFPFKLVMLTGIATLIIFGFTLYTYLNFSGLNEFLPLEVKTSLTPSQENNNRTMDIAGPCTTTGGLSGLQSSAGNDFNSNTGVKNAKDFCSEDGFVAKSVAVAATSRNKLASAYMGVNLNWFSDSSWQDQVFVDLVKQSRGFATAAYPYDPTNHPPPVDSDGWPTSDFGNVFASFPADPLGKVNKPRKQVNPIGVSTFMLFTDTYCRFGTVEQVIGDYTGIVAFNHRPDLVFCFRASLVVYG